MSKNHKIKDNIVIKGGYVKTRTPFSSEEVVRGCGVHKDKKKENNKKRCRGKIRDNDYTQSPCIYYFYNYNDLTFS